MVSNTKKKNNAPTTEEAEKARGERLSNIINWALLIILFGCIIYLYFSGQLVRTEYIYHCPGINEFNLSLVTP